jgi:ABC-type maltose transport system permease subunit
VYVCARCFHSPIAKRNKTNKCVTWSQAFDKILVYIPVHLIRYVWIINYGLLIILLCTQEPNDNLFVWPSLRLLKTWYFSEFSLSFQYSTCGSNLLVVHTGTYDEWKMHSECPVKSRNTQAGKCVNRRISISHVVVLTFIFESTEKHYKFSQVAVSWRQKLLEFCIVFGNDGKM